MEIDCSTNCLTIHFFTSPTMRLIALCIVIRVELNCKNLCIDLVSDWKRYASKLSELVRFEEENAFQSIKCALTSWTFNQTNTHWLAEWQWLNTIFTLSLSTISSSINLASISVFYLIRRRRRQSSCFPSSLLLLLLSGQLQLLVHILSKKVSVRVLVVSSSFALDLD